MEKAVQELMGITIFCFDILAISTVFRWKYAFGALNQIEQGS
jgi:hypothetical protein